MWLKASPADLILFSGDERAGSCLARCCHQALQVGGGVAVVIGKGDPGGELQALGFKAGKELLRAGDAAEGGDRAIDGRNLHLAMQPPDHPFEARCAQSGLQFGSAIRRGNGDDCGTASGRNRFAEVARWQQAVAQPVAAIEQQNVYVAVELAMLKAVV